MHMPQMPEIPTWREIWHKDHPIWAVLQKALMIGGALLILQHGGAEVIGKDGAHATEAVGGMWILRELIGWKRA